MLWKMMNMLKFAHLKLIGLKRAAQQPQSQKSFKRYWKGNPNKWMFETNFTV